jgi:7-cyano-7-deazaguanine synthase
LTRTCYKDQELSCGRCGSCQERLEAFKNIGVKDPIRYQEE